MLVARGMGLVFCGCWGCMEVFVCVSIVALGLVFGVLCARVGLFCGVRVDELVFSCVSFMMRLAHISHMGCWFAKCGSRHKMVATLGHDLFEHLSVAFW